MEFYKNLEKCMQMKGITAYKIAKNTSISNSTLTDWKKGKMPSVEKVIELVRFLEISADELLGTDYKVNLTEKEKNLLNYFKNCNEGNKEIILNAAKSLQENNEKKQEKSSGLMIG